MFHINHTMAYSIHGHISYILETNSKSPIRKKKRKEIENKAKGNKSPFLIVMAPDHQISNVCLVCISYSDQ